MKPVDKNASPKAVQAAFRQAESLANAGHHAQALPIYQQIVRAKPRWPYAYYGLADLYANLGQFSLALSNIRKAIDRKPNHALFYAKIAEIENRLDDKDSALQSVGRAIELEPKNPQHIVTKATILRSNADPQAAFDLLESALPEHKTDDQLVRFYASLAGALGDPKAGIDILEPLTQTINPDPIVTATHHFTLAKLYDQAEQYGLAYQAAAAGAKLRGDTYSPDQRESQLTERIAAWSKTRLDSLPRSRVKTDKPIFIVGMPRSGTTLIEQIIAAHPDAYGCGELIGILEADAEIGGELESLKPAMIDRIARRVLKGMESQVPKGEKPKRVTDKLPLNFQHLGLIEVLFPQARVIHCRRGVLDNFISCYLLDFAGVNNHAYAYDPGHFAHFYSVYLRTMEHWKSVCSVPILDVEYEEVVGDQLGQTERILEFVGLGWDDACMAFFEARRAVNTASVEQVRKGMYSSSVGRWKNYQGEIGAVQDALRARGVAF
jgi:tetratricopeptide (TPR) repeat protein